MITKFKTVSGILEEYYTQAGIPFPIKKVEEFEEQVKEEPMDLESSKKEGEDEIEMGQYEDLLVN